MSKISLEEGFKKGYLKRKKVYLKPVPRGGKLISDPKHVAYFQYEGATTWLSLTKAKNSKSYVDVFASDEEREFFEDRLGGANLNVYLKTNDTQTNYWDAFYVKITKDWELMNTGYSFDLSNPEDNLKVRVLKEHPFVAPSWEKKTARGEYRFALVDEGYEEKKEVNHSEKLVEAYTHFGSIQNSKVKMSEFVGRYLLETKSLKELPSDASSDFLRKEIKKHIDNDIDTVIKLINDPKSSIKLFILKALKANAITKEGRNSYSIPGEGVKYMYNELVDYISNEEDVKGDTYLKIDAIIKQKK